MAGITVARVDVALEKKSVASLRTYMGGEGKLVDSENVA